jgi:DNA polymerase I-like protein with 3'-5' exonuclease and polymerase domains
MRILAHLSRDPELTRIFNDPNGDVHTETSEWLGLNDRNVAKEINFAICFGMGPGALTQKINELKERQMSTDLIDLATAQSYIDGFHARFPEVRAFFDQEWKKMKGLPAQERVVRSHIGRERRFPRRPYSETVSQFRVRCPQQIDADLIKTAMVRLDRIFRHKNLRSFSGKSKILEKYCQVICIVSFSKRGTIESIGEKAKKNKRRKPPPRSRPFRFEYLGKLQGHR